jgi:hypothetical protein
MQINFTDEYLNRRSWNHKFKQLQNNVKYKTRLVEIWRNGLGSFIAELI